MLFRFAVLGCVVATLAAASLCADEPALKAKPQKKVRTGQRVRLVSGATASDPLPNAPQDPPPPVSRGTEPRRKPTNPPTLHAPVYQGPGIGRREAESEDG